MEQYLKGKTVLVTGAGWGIGAASALLYAASGANVIVSDTSRKGGRDIMAKIRSQKGTATYIRTDVSDPAACAKLIKRTVEKYGSIDIACNNSAIFSEPMYPTGKDMDAFDDEVGVNLNGLNNCMHYEIEAMLRQGGGIIVNTSSIMGGISLASLGQFVNVKYGLAALRQNPPGEYPARGISINTIAPTLINSVILNATIQTGGEKRIKSSPVGRPGLAQEVAGLVLLLSSDETQLFPHVFKDRN